MALTFLGEIGLLTLLKLPEDSQQRRGPGHTDHFREWLLAVDRLRLQKISKLFVLKKFLNFFALT